MITLELNINSKNLIDDELVACIGYFDGLHLGHRKLITKTLEYAKQLNKKSALISFKNNPKEVVLKNKIKQIQSLNQRSTMLKDLGFDYFIMIDFNQTMMNLTVEQFHQLLKDNFSITKIICGFDFNYAKNGLGNHLSLENAFDVEVISSINYHNQKISTTLIKKFLACGDVITVNKLLGYQYQITSKVVLGRQLGRSIGIPTANLEIDHNLFYLKNGVYAAMVDIDGTIYKSVVNIGYNPTVSSDDILKIEVHLIGFDGDLYDRELRVDFIKRIRDELKFNSLIELKRQLLKDIEEINNEAIIL